MFASADRSAGHLIRVRSKVSISYPEDHRAWTLPCPTDALPGVFWNASATGRKGRNPPVALTTRSGRAGRVARNQSRRPSRGNLPTPRTVLRYCPPQDHGLARLLAAVVGQPVRDFAERGAAGRGRDLGRLIVRVQARKRDPRLEARPRAIVGEALASAVGHSANRQGGRGPCRGGSERAGPLRRRVPAREAPYPEPEPLPELLHALRGRGPAPAVVRGVPLQAEAAQHGTVRVGSRARRAGARCGRRSRRRRSRSKGFRRRGARSSRSSTRSERGGLGPNGSSEDRGRAVIMPARAAADARALWTDRAFDDGGAMSAHADKRGRPQEVR